MARARVGFLLDFKSAERNQIQANQSEPNRFNTKTSNRFIQASKLYSAADLSRPRSRAVSGRLKQLRTEGANRRNGATAGDRGAHLETLTHTVALCERASEQANKQNARATGRTSSTRTVGCCCCFVFPPRSCHNWTTITMRYKPALLGRS